MYGATVALTNFKRPILDATPYYWLHPFLIKSTIIRNSSRVHLLNTILLPLQPVDHLHRVVFNETMTMSMATSVKSPLSPTPLSPSFVPLQ